MVETDEVRIPVNTEGLREAMRDLDKLEEKTGETRKTAEEDGGIFGGASVGGAVGGFAGAAIGTVVSQSGIADVAGGFMGALLGGVIVAFQDEIRAVVKVLANEVVPLLKKIAGAVGATLGDTVDFLGRDLSDPSRQMTTLGDVAKLTGVGAGTGFLLGGPQGALAGGVTGLTVGGTNYLNDRFGLFGPPARGAFAGMGGPGVSQDLRIEQTFAPNNPSVSDPELMADHVGRARGATVPGVSIP